MAPQMSILPLRYDEYCDLVGGLEWSLFLNSLTEIGQQERRSELEKLDRSLASIRDFVYKQDRQNRYGLEVLLLKLSVFTTLCREVQDIQRIGRLPLLNINPNSVRVGFSEGNHLVPRLWNYRLAITEAENNGVIETLPTSSPNRPALTLYMYPGIAEGEVHGAEADLYSLGMMLLRSLLVNTQQNETGVLGYCHQIWGKLHQFSVAGASPETTKQIYDLLQQLFQEPVLQTKNLFFHPPTYADRAVSINATLWNEALTIGFRLITQVPEFSYFQTHPQDQHLPIFAGLDDVINDLNALNDKVQHALFIDPPKMDYEIHSLISELLNEKDWMEKLAASFAQTEPVVVRQQPSNVKQISQYEAPSSLEETIIVTKGAVTTPSRSSPPATVNPSDLSQQSPPREVPREQTPSANGRQGERKEPYFQETQNGLDETIIIRGGTGGGANRGFTPPASTPKVKETSVEKIPIQQNHGQTENLEETIIIPSKKK